MTTPPIFWRSPRMNPDLPKEEIEIQAPPAEPSPPSGSLLTMLLPAFLMAAVMVGIGFAMKTSSWLIFSVPMVVVSSLASVITHSVQKRTHKKKLVEREQSYRRVLRAYRRDLETHQHKQQEILCKNNPDPEECLSHVRTLKRDLWSRSPEHDDFLELRLGIGQRLSSVTVKAPKSHDPTKQDPLVLAAQDLARKFEYVPLVPVSMSLREAGVSGLAGPRQNVLEMARSVAIQIATHHSPDEVKIIAVYPAEEEKEWSWLRWLPHTWSDDRRLRFLASDKQSTHYLFATLDEWLDQRWNQMSDARGTGSTSPVFPSYFVFLLAAPSLTENEPLLQRLQTEGPSLGALPIFLRDRVKSLPKDCRTMAKLGPDQFFLTNILPSVVSYPFVPDLASREFAREFARAMAPIRLKSATAKEIPSSVTLLELLGVQTVEELNASDRWQNSESVQRSLAAPIGIRIGGDPLTIDLHERAHGPNGLVAGMVGAGKSEMLQTLIACLATQFHPHKVAFVLVDYKGGGTADPFAKLPHTLGIITNLEKGNLAIRALTSFNVEAERRQRLFAAAGVNHIDDYQRLYYRGQVKEPLPYLVIIVDEFAEMKTEQPDVATEFVRIARVGRAGGFRLILAMQKPAGIVDGQIEANTRFRLCLRVAQTEDSQAMLKRPEAAYLAGVGRAYFQIGANEMFEEFQVAWSGAPYDPAGIGVDAREIAEIALNGAKKILYYPPRPRIQEETTQLKAVVNYLADVAERAGIEGLPGLWLPPLPEQIALDQLRSDEGWDGQHWKKPDLWMMPVVGLADEPKIPDQRSLRLDFGKQGHLAVYGAPGYGKTTFLQTLVASLALSYSPADVHIYLLDFGGRLLKQLEPLPHVGGVVLADEPERLSRLWRYLLREMDKRRELLGHAGVATLGAYRDSTGERLPAIVVMIDSFASFRNAYEDDEEIVAQISREGGGLGIHLVLTANDSATIRFRISSNISMAIALHLVEQGDCSAIVGRTGGLVPEAEPGRGLVRAKPPLEFQTALPVGGDTDGERSSALRYLVEEMAAAWDGPMPLPVPVLPDIVPLADVLPPGQEWFLPTKSKGSGEHDLSVPLGLYVEDLETFCVDLASGGGAFLDRRSGRKWQNRNAADVASGSGRMPPSGQTADVFDRLCAYGLAAPFSSATH